VSGISEEFERVVHKLAVRMVRHAIQEDCSDHLDAKIGSYVDAYIRSPAIREDVKQAVYEFCRDDSEFVTQVRRIAGEIVNSEIRQAVAARLREEKVGDYSFTDWLVRIAVKESLNSEVVRQTIETSVRSQIEEIMKRILMNGLMGSPGAKV